MNPSWSCPVCRRTYRPMVPPIRGIPYVVKCRAHDTEAVSIP